MQRERRGTTRTPKTSSKDSQHAQKMDPKGCKLGRSEAKSDPRENNDPEWTQQGIKGRQKRPQRESIEEPDGIPETKWKLTWTQKVSKKEPKLETLEMMKIELSLQPELNPAC